MGRFHQTGSVLTQKGGMVMVDLEKVIKGLEHCAKEADCRGCVYQEQMKGRSDGCDCMREALDMLKEQEPVKPTWSQGKAYCGNCGHGLPRRADMGIDYCGYCGRAVKWND